MTLNKKIVIATLCGLMLGNTLPKANAIDVLGGLGSVIKTGGIAWMVDHYASDINTFINKLTDKYGVGTTYATKVVPIITVGSKGYVGAAQVSGPQALVDKCQAALAIEGDFLNRSFRIQILIPIDSKDGSSFHRVQGIGVSAKVDVAI